ncbi:MAG: M48 family metallopeptidase [Candidatus Omnitrophota bacterium]|jgi:predicted Zn-dependent protease|nr:M48 family metallopeptidase [Candidatus Omnitrophota bacterium]
MYKFIGSLLLASFILVGSGCATTYNPATGQNELIFITTPVETSIGNMVSARVANQFKFSADKEETERLSEIGKKLVSVSDRKDLKYKFTVIEDDSLNAFTIPGGYIYVNTGVLEKASDDELACVIGHEIGHVAARHIAKKLQTQIGYNIVMSIASKSGNLGELQRAASISFDLISLGYSREDELQGDRLGAKYAHKAGYDPYAMVTFLEKIKKEEKGNIGPVFLRSHPYASQRIKLLKKAIPDIIAKLDNKSSTKKIPHQEQRLTPKRKSDAIEERPLKIMCPKCKKIFSGKTTNYCPYDGTKL